MRILQMTHQGDIGGSTNSITWLTRGLAGRGHDVWLACRPESLIASRFQDGPATLVPTSWPRGIRLWKEARRWKAWIREHRIDIVNAHASLDRHIVSYLRLQGERAGLLHTRRNLSLTTGGSLRARFDVATTDAIIAVSQGVAEDLYRRGIPEPHVAVIRNGVPLSELPVADPERTAAVRAELRLREGVPVVGVIARRKSQDDLLRAVQSHAGPLEILFSGIEEDAELAALRATLPGNVRAQCLGYRPDVAEISALLDIFVLPSGIEGFSLAILEAMARGLPCIASDAGGNREALDHGAGIIVPPGNPEALAKALARLLRDPDAARKMGDTARRRAHAEFDVARTVERTEALYERVLAGRAR